MIMKFLENEENRTLLNKILTLIIAFLLLVIFLGTIFGLLSKKRNTPEVLISQGKAVSLMAPSDTDQVSYFELGTIRISTAGNNSTPGTILVLSPWVAYPSGDTVFFEELSRKKGAIKGIFSAYFSSRTKNELLSETEEKIEAVIKQEINADLALGQISDIYFTDYLFLE